MTITSNSKETRGVLKVGPVKQIVWPMVEVKNNDGSDGSLTSSSDTSLECKDCLVEDKESTTANIAELSLPSAPVDNEMATNESNDQDASSIQSTEPRRTVKFTSLEIREYPICIGDNPAVTMGVPITIDWAHDGKLICTVEEYEEHRPAPRSMAQLRMPSRHRDDLLRRIGYSRRDIMEGTKYATMARNQRKRTTETLNLACAQEFIELTRRAALNATFRRGAKRKEREFLEQYKPIHEDEKVERLSMVTAPLDTSAVMQ